MRDYLDALDSGGESQYYLQMRCLLPVEKGKEDSLTPWWSSLKAPRYALGKLVAISAWIGNAHFGFGLHRDECREQFLCQMSGTKRVVMIEPTLGQTRAVYPYRSFDWGFRSQVFDSDEPDLAKFPKFKDAKISVALLEPGDILFLPNSWWHDVRPNGGFNASIGFRHRCENWKREKARVRLQILLSPRVTGDSTYWFKSVEDPVDARFEHIQSTHFREGSLNEA